MMPDRFDHIYLEATDARQRAELDEYVGRTPTPEQDEKGLIRTFLEGVTKGMRNAPNVFRPFDTPEEAARIREGGGIPSTDPVSRIGEAVALPFTIPFEGLMGGLEESGIISKRTREQIGASLMGALPAMIGGAGPTPKVGEVVAAGREALRGAEPGVGKVRPAEVGARGEILNPYAEPGKSPEPVEPKQPWEMTLPEIRQALESAKTGDSALLVDLFGEEGAKKYRALERRSNSSDSAKADAAYKEQAAMEESLTEEQRNRLFGIGESGPSVEDLRSYEQKLSDIRGDSETPADLGRSLRWAITKVGEESDPAKMTYDQRLAYTQIQEAFRIAQEEGWNTAEVSAAAIKAAGERFADPEDAAFMLRRFTREETSPQPPGELPPAEPPVSPDTESPKGMPTPGEVRINLARVDATEPVKQTIAAVNALTSERQATGRAPQPHAVTEGEATASTLTLEQALSLPDEPLLAKGDQLRLRDLHNDAATTLHATKEAAKGGDPAALSRLWADFAVTSELSLRDEGAGRATARALEARKILSDPTRLPEESRPGTYSPEEVAQIAERVKGLAGGDPQVLITMLDTLEATKGAPETFARRVNTAVKTGAAKTSDVLYELWINSLLSNPQSHAANVLSNTLTALWAPVERAVAGVMPGGEIGVGEAAAMVRGIVEGTADALRFGRELEQASGSKVEQGPAITSQNTRLEGTGVGRAIDLIGAGIRIPTTLLQGEDSFFKTINTHMEVKAQAFREARSEGLQPGSPDFAERVRYIEQHIEEFPSLLEAAKQFSLLQTFQDEMGPIGKAIDRLRQVTPGGRVVLPFLKTPSRILAYASQRIPGVNLPSLLKGQLADDIAAGGARRQLALARVSAGAAVTGAIAYYAAGGQLTGGGPANKDLKRALRDTGWQPYSVKVGNEYIAYNRLDPFGMMLGTVADAVEILGQVPEWQAEEIGATVVLALSKNFVSKTYLEGVSNVLEAMSDPDRGAKSWTHTLTRSAVPGIVKNIERQIDPELREARSALDEIRANVPGWSSSLPPRRNLFGDPVMAPAGFGPDFLSPIYTSQASADPVASEIARLKVDLTMPSRVFSGTRPPAVRMQSESPKEGVELTPEEYDYLVVQAGNALKGPDGMGMKDTLAALIQGTEYQQATDAAKAFLVRKVVHGFREAAKGKLLEESEGLRELVEERMRKRAEALTGQAAPVFAR